MMQLTPLIATLRAIAEPSRLRILALLVRGDLSVGELCQVLGQSQPRLSRHLKLLTDVGCVERHPEGTWVFYRAAADMPARSLIDAALSLIAPTDPVFLRDLERLATIREERAQAAASYFARIAEGWDVERRLLAEPEAIEALILEAFGDVWVEFVLDLGTGTGRMLELVADRAGRVEGVDSSHQMLTIARANLAARGVANATVRHGDVAELPFPAGVADRVIVHQVLHFLDAPERAIAEAARVLRPGGRLIVADIEPHTREILRTDHSHWRLGIPDSDMRTWVERAGLRLTQAQSVQGASELCVRIWAADKPGSASPKLVELAA
jgi:ArsR family transcriptional regulator